MTFNEQGEQLGCCCCCCGCCSYAEKLKGGGEREKEKKREYKKRGANMAVERVSGKAICIKALVRLF